MRGRFFSHAFALLLSAAVLLPAQGHVASDLAHEVLGASLDPARCYHVRDVAIHEADATFYLTDGYLIFGHPVNGQPVSAVFTTETEGGNAEVVMLPPDRAERRTLAAFTGSPNLDEHFTQAVFFFTDHAARALEGEIAKSPTAERIQTQGLLMADRWNLTVTGLMTSFASRIVLDLMTKGPGGEGFFQAAIRGRTLGDFDVVHDARATEQIAVGRVNMHSGQPGWDTWMRFTDTAARCAAPPAPEEQILHYRIDASLDASLAMRCVTTLHIRAERDSQYVIPLDMAGEMRVLSAKVDGVAAEVYQRESMRGGLIQNSGNELFLVVPPQPLTPGTEHDIEIVHEGKVVRETPDHVYFVSARGTWYPGRAFQFASYDAVFHYPENLQLVSAGLVKENFVENGIRTTHRVAEGKLRLLGFNLGRYTVRSSEKNGMTLDMCASPEFDAALRPGDIQALIPPPPSPVNVIRLPRLASAPTPPEASPLDRAEAMAADLQAALAFFRARFGEPPLNRVAVSPIPGRFGQGFAGMIYLPTQMYRNAADLPVRPGSPVDEEFLWQILPIHEAAHQWWGSVVTADSYHHEWLMESLANYSALMFLESRMGPKALERGLDLYRAELVVKAPDGGTAESQGPVVEGRRLESASPRAANAVLYGKGTWIIHMLRRRLGDAAFLKMLAELRRRYEWKTVTTEDFRLLCAEFLPPGASDPKLVDFFDQWVYDTGMPTLKLTWSIAAGGKKLTGSVSQKDVPPGFSVMAPVEIRAGAGKPVIKMVRTGDEPAKFSVDVPGPGAKAVLDPGWAILKR